MAGCFFVPCRGSRWHFGCQASDKTSRMTSVFANCSQTYNTHSGIHLESSGRWTGNDVSRRAQNVLKWWLISYIRSKVLYLCAHAHCRAGPSVDCNSVEELVMWRVVRKLVDSPLFLRDGVCSLAGHPPRDVQTHTQQQHAQHCRITGHAEVEEREWGDSGWPKPIPNALVSAAVSVWSPEEQIEVGGVIAAVDLLLHHCRRPQLLTTDT